MVIYYKISYQSLEQLCHMVTNYEGTKLNILLWQNIFPCILLEEYKDTGVLGSSQA